MTLAEEVRALRKEVAALRESNEQLLGQQIEASKGMRRKAIEAIDDDLRRKQFGGQENND